MQRAVGAFKGIKWQVLICINLPEIKKRRFGRFGRDLGKNTLKATSLTGGPGCQRNGRGKRAGLLRREEDGSRGGLLGLAALPLFFNSFLFLFFNKV